MLKLIVSSIFPMHCFICKETLTEKELPYFCSTHAAGLKLNNGRYCLRCSLPLDKIEAELSCPDCAETNWHFEKVLSLYLYQSPLSEMMIAFKYHKKRFLIRFFQQLLLAQKETLLCFKDKTDILVPVPLDLLKQKERGFNQSYLIAKIAAQLLARPVYSRVLGRKIDAAPFGKAQATLGRLERKELFQGAFIFGGQKKQAKGKEVLLVDDVFTTGSTANACARTLLEMGAKSVSVLTLARTPLKSQKTLII